MQEVVKMERSIIDVMLQQYDSFTTAEKKIVDYVTTHQKESQYISITELSAACNVAISTVSVFCRKLRLSGFNDFKIELARADIMVSPGRSAGEEDAEIRPGDTTSEMVRKVLANSRGSLRRTAQMLDETAVDQAAAWMQAAGQVVFAGVGNGGQAARTAALAYGLLSPKGKAADEPTAISIALAGLSEGDVVIYLEDGGADDVRRAEKLAKGALARFVLITSHAYSPAAEEADALLVCGAEEPGGRSLLGQQMTRLLLLEVLLKRYAMLAPEACSQYGDRVTKALDQEKISL